MSFEQEKESLSKRRVPRPKRKIERFEEEEEEETDSMLENKDDCKN